MNYFGIRKLNEELNKLLDEAKGTVADIDDIRNIGFIPVPLKDIIQKYNIKPNISLEELKEKYRQAYNDFIKETNDRISNAINKPFPNNVWNWKLKQGEVYKGATKERGGKPVHNTLGGINWYYEITKNGKPYTQVKDEKELINILSQHINETLEESFEEKDILSMADTLRYLATNSDLSMEDGSILLKASIILEDNFLN